MKCFDLVESVLNKDLNKSKNSTHSEISTIEETLKRLKEFHISLIANYRHFHLFLQPSVLFSWIMGATILIFNLYTVVLIHSDKAEANWLIEVEWYASISSLVIYLLVAEYVQNVVSNFQNLPFNFVS